MLFYVPPLLPVLATVQNGTARQADDFFGTLEKARLPLRYMANLFAGGNEEAVTRVYRRLLAMRLLRRAETVGDRARSEAEAACTAAGITAEEAAAMFRLTALAGMQERIVIPTLLREQAAEAVQDPQAKRQEMGFGTRRPPKRRF